MPKKKYLVTLEDKINNASNANNSYTVGHTRPAK